MLEKEARGIVGEGRGKGEKDSDCAPLKDRHSSTGRGRSLHVRRFEVLGPKVRFVKWMKKKNCRKLRIALRIRKEDRDGISGFSLVGHCYTIRSTSPSLILGAPKRKVGNGRNSRGRLWQKRRTSARRGPRGTRGKGKAPGRHNPGTE